LTSHIESVYHANMTILQHFFKNAMHCCINTDLKLSLVVIKLLIIIEKR